MDTLIHTSVVLNEDAKFLLYNILPIADSMYAREEIIRSRADAEKALIELDVRVHEMSGGIVKLEAMKTSVVQYLRILTEFTVSRLKGRLMPLRCIGLLH